MSVAENHSLHEVCDEQAERCVTRVLFRHEIVKTLVHNTSRHFTNFFEQEPHDAGQSP